MDNEQTTDVTTESPAVETPQSEGVSSAPAAVQGESQTQSSTEQPTGEAAAPFQVPENDDDLKGQETNPHVQAIVQLRQELRARNQSLDEYKPLDTWKPLVETIGDPALAQSAYELVSSIHSPSQENPSGFTSVPFLDQIEKEAPGTLNVMFSEMLAFPITDAQGQPTTVVRELYRGHGLDPDRIDDYRNIDQLRASGVVTTDDLTKIPEKYHEAFKSMSQVSREDLLEIIGSKPLVAEESLRNAQASLETQQYKAQQQQQIAEQEQRQEAELRGAIETAVTEGVNAKIQTWSNSIHQSLSQWKPSADEAVNDFERSKVISLIATLQNPAYRPVAEKALAHAGVSLEWADQFGHPWTFDGLVNQWQTAFSATVAYEQTGQKDSFQAKRAAATASQAEQRILIKLQDIAEKLSKPTGNRLATASQQQAGQLATAQSRFVPSGNGSQANGSQNPYSNNPHPVGSQEYFAHNRKIDKEFQLTNAAAYGG